MNTVIIGGSGFLGSRLIFEMQNQVLRNIDRNPSPFYSDITSKGDIRYSDQIRLEANESTVVLLAAEHRDDIRPVNRYYDVS